MKFSQLIEDWLRREHPHFWVYSQLYSIGCGCSSMVGIGKILEDSFIIKVTIGRKLINERTYAADPLFFEKIWAQIDETHEGWKNLLASGGRVYGHAFSEAKNVVDSGL